MSRAAVPDRGPPPPAWRVAVPRPHPGRWTPAATSTAAKGCELTGQLLLLVVLAAVLGPDGYGVFALVFTLVGLLSSSLSIGGPTLASRLIPAVAAEDRPATARVLAARLGRWRAIQAAWMTVVIAGLALVDPQRFPPLVCLFAGAALVLDLAATLLFQIGLGLGRTAIFSFRFPVQNGLVVAGVLALNAVFGEPGAIAAITLSAGVVLIWAALTVGRVLAGARRHGEPAEAGAPSIPKEIWRFGIHQGLGGLLVTIVQRGAVVATALLGASSRQQGFTAVAVGVGIAGTYVVSQAFAVSLPGLVEVSQAAAAAAEQQALRLATRAVLLTGVLAIAGAVVVAPVLPVLLGGGFRGGESALYVGLALLPLAGPTALIAQVAALRLASRRLLACRAIGLVAFACICVSAIPGRGALGALLAVLGGLVVTLVTSAAAIAVPGGRRLASVGLAASAAAVLVGVVS
jgi:O-antigen/teichoic acid export membrane protein